MHDQHMAMTLSETAQRFILHWGEMGAAWGVNRTVAQIHALLFYYGRPMHAEEICQLLGVARSNVSNSIRELQNWGLVQTTHVLGDRRDYFETSTDIWILFRVIVTERKRREYLPTLQLLGDLVQSEGFRRENPLIQARLRQTYEFMQALGVWADEMLNLSPVTLDRVIKLGAKVQVLFRGKPVDESERISRS